MYRARSQGKNETTRQWIIKMVNLGFVIALFFTVISVGVNIYASSQLIGKRYTTGTVITKPLDVQCGGRGCQSNKLSAAYSVNGKDYTVSTWSFSAQYRPINGHNPDDGQKTAVYYNPTNPTDAVVGSLSKIWANSTRIFVATLFLGVIRYFLSKRNVQADRSPKANKRSNK